MKIAIVGTHSTGKTTLVNELEKHLNNQGFKTAILPELCRFSPHPINERTNYDAQTWIQTKHIEEEAKINHIDKILICDRSTLDNFAYFQKAVIDKNIKQWERMSAQHMYTYDLVFKTRKLDIDAVEDGIRSTDDKFRTDIDILIKKLFRRHGIKFHKLPKSTDYKKHINFIKKKITPLMHCPLRDKSLYSIIKKF
jgi:nicotinamide riboside kinase